MFANGSEARQYQDNNCLQCCKYEAESTIRDNAGCKYAFDIDVGFVSGNIRQSTLEAIGSSLCCCKKKEDIDVKI